MKYFEVFKQVSRLIVMFLRDFVSYQIVPFQTLTDNFSTNSKCHSCIYVIPIVDLYLKNDLHV